MALFIVDEFMNCGNRSPYFLAPLFTFYWQNYQNGIKDLTIRLIIFVIVVGIKANETKKTKLQIWKYVFPPNVFLICKQQH